VAGLKTEIPGFEMRSEGSELVISRGEFGEFLATQPVSDLLAGGTGAVEGRKVHTVVDLPGGARAVVRHYTHGGLLRKLTGDRFAGSERFFEEVRVSEHLRARGVNTPEVLGLVVTAGKLGFRRGMLITRMVEGGQDMLVYLRSEEGLRQIADPQVKRELLKNAAVQTRRMHDANVFHADLHVKNLLLAPDGRIFILDLDRARRSRRISMNHRLSNLTRLGRSIEKTGLTQVITGRDMYVFFVEYMRAGPVLDMDAREVVKRYRRHVARHRLFWKMGFR
jgi:tRNA A-37 threonylcarbamoyl transferase component Bud32